MGANTYAHSDVTSLLPRRFCESQYQTGNAGPPGSFVVYKFVAKSSLFRYSIKMEELDKSIIKAAKHGDLNAFEQIVFRFEKPLYSYLYRLCSHGPTAEDLVQETFVKIYKHLKKIKLEGNFTSWVFTIATHTAYDYLRKKKHMQELFIIDDPESDFETITQEHSYTIVEQLADAETVNQAMEKLKPEYKTVLLLFYKLDLAYETIAKMLGVPIGTVKTYLHRAKKALKNHLQK